MRLPSGDLPGCGAGFSRAFLDLPFFWDEVGQFVPASLDLFHSGALVPYSVTPNAHPPGLMAYLALVWSIAGYSITATRLAMLLLAGVSVLAVLRLANKLGARGALVALLLCCSPVFYAQAMLAQLDMPAMLFTLLATLLFLEERIFWSAAACVALVLVKETGVVTPMLFGFWLLVERRPRESAYFLLPAAALGAWLFFLKYKTGHLFGSAEFTEYNLTYMLHPVRMGVALRQADLSPVLGELALDWRLGDRLRVAARRGYSRSRSWRIVWTLVALHVLLFSVLGGAMLERYLLPVTPIVYIAMVAGWSAMPSPWRVVGPVAFIVAVAACNFWNPPYPFPLENNLAFTDFVRLQQSAASYLEQRLSGNGGVDSMAALGRALPPGVRICGGASSRAGDSGFQRIVRGQPAKFPGRHIRSLLPPVGPAGQSPARCDHRDAVAALLFVRRAGVAGRGGPEVPAEEGRKLDAPRTVDRDSCEILVESMPDKTVLAVVNDIFFQAKISGAAKQAGVTLKYVTTEQGLLDNAKTNPALIVFDLNFAAVEPIQLIAKLKSDPELRQIRLLG